MNQALAAREAVLAEAETAAQLEAERVDITTIAPRARVGARHPVSLLQEEIADLFVGMGWEIADGELRIDVTLPPGVTATAITPAGACRGRLDGRRLAPQSPGTKIASGRHRLVFGLAPQNERQ